MGRGGVPSTYHCDYVWLSPDLAATLVDAEVGGMEDWVLSGLSDHCPVWCDLALPGVR